MNIIFLGTPEFAVKCLDALRNSKHKILAVVAQPDKPSERGNKIEFSAIKKYAIENNLKLFQFPKISRDGIEDLKALKPDIMVTASYGQLLSQEVINIPKYGIINVHASLLPKFRGAAPIQSAIIQGETETGITIMRTEIGMDTGDIIAVEKTPIFENETAGELSNRLAVIGSRLLLDSLDSIENGTVTYTAQEHVNATVTKKIKKEDAVINWEKSAKEIKCLILGTNPSPVARTTLGEEVVKIYRAKVADFNLEDNEQGLPVGTVLPKTSAKNGVFVKTGNGILEILEMQFPGGKVLPAKVLVNGRKIKPFDKFLTTMIIG